MERKGWIKIWHKLADDPMWLEEPFTKGQAWVDLLLIASTQDSANPGEVRCSLRWLAGRWKWSKDKVSRFLARLEKDGTVFRTQNRTANGTFNRTLLTIAKYGSYQKDRTQNRTENETQNGPKNRNKEEDDKKIDRPTLGGGGRKKKEERVVPKQFQEWFSTYEAYEDWRSRNS